MNIETTFVCPSCRKELTRVEGDFSCEVEEIRYSSKDRITDFLLPSRRQEIDEFLRCYQLIRRSERWGSDSVEYYLKLPHRDTTGEHKRIWRIRARTFDCFLTDFHAETGTRKMTVLDLGAGSCWLSYKLAQEGHRVFAVDINLDNRDGLGVSHRLPRLGTLLPLRAEMGSLPFSHHFFDVIIFNASLHYSSYPLETIKQTLPFLNDNGILYVLDSPIYTCSEDGNNMVSQKIRSFKEDYGVDIPEHFAGSYLTYQDMNDMQANGLVRTLQPNYGIAWAVRRFVTKTLSRYEPANFQIIKITKRK